MGRKLLKHLGSLKFAVALIGGLALILIVSTIIESEYGTPFAQRHFYRTRWFDGFLAMIGVNIFCATLRRRPFQRRHTGFVITHAGLLTILAGALISRLLGVEGQMTLAEGMRQAEIAQEVMEIRAQVSDAPPIILALEDVAAQLPKEISVGGARLTIKKFLHNIHEETVISDGTPESPKNLALNIVLSSPALETTQSLWLVEKDPTGSYGSSVSMGPAVIGITDQLPTDSSPTPAPQKPSLKISRKSGDLIAEIDLANPDEVKKDGLTISQIRYFERATVTDNKIADSEDPNRYFPAVEFTLSDGVKSERHVKFALVPEFDSLHGRATAFDVTSDLVVPRRAPTRGPALLFSAAPDGTIRYRSSSSASTTGGVAEKGTAIPTGWMDMTFRIEQAYRRANPVVHVAPAPGDSQGMIGVEVDVQEKGAPPSTQWVTEARPLHRHSPEGMMTVVLQSRTLPLPFSLQLKDFRKVDYPGTSRAASFESDVILNDLKNNTTIERTISMNNPLDYAGYRIFQSSYGRDPVAGETSTFSIARDPGTTVIYTGAIVMFTGVLLLFYIRPLSRTANP